MSGETLRLEEWTDQLGAKMVVVWSSSVDNAWLPTEFMLSAYITRILIVGRSAGASIALAADQGWTQVWRSPGAKEWSCLLGILPHMPGPILIVIGPDVAMTPKIGSTLRSTGGTVLVLRAPSATAWSGEAPDAVFFPIIPVSPSIPVALMSVLQEWSGKAAPRTLDFRAVLPQLSMAGYALAIVNGTWHWYKPADSAPLATMTVSQIARQIQSLGIMLERMIV
jgi:hypothetical protein